MAEKNVIERNKIDITFYTAPEVINKKYNEKCDIWSCGVIMYLLLSARPPFGGETEDENDFLQVY